MGISTTRKPQWQIQSHQRHHTYLVCQAPKTGQKDSGIHIYCSHIYAENSTHNFYRKTGSKTASLRLLVLLVDSIIFLMSIAGDWQKGCFLAMIEINSQKRQVCASSIVFKAHLWPFPSSWSVLLSLPQLGPSIPHLKHKHLKKASWRGLDSKRHNCSMWHKVLLGNCLKSKLQTLDMQ